MNQIIQITRHCEPEGRGNLFNIDPHVASLLRITIVFLLFTFYLLFPSPIYAQGAQQSCDINNDQCAPNFSCQEYTGPDNAIHQNGETYCFSDASGTTSVPAAAGGGGGSTTTSTTQSVDSVFGKVEAPAFVSKIGFGNAGISKFLGNIIGLLYAAGMIIFVFMIVLSAVQWIASGGDKEALTKARSRMTNAIIGIVLLAAAGLIIVTIGKIVGFQFFG